VHVHIVVFWVMMTLYNLEGGLTAYTTSQWMEVACSSEMFVAT